jgi:hypothetical protein
MLRRCRWTKGQHTSLGKWWFHYRCPASWIEVSSVGDGRYVIGNRSLTEMKKMNRTCANVDFDIFFLFLIKQWTNTTTDVPTSFTSYFVSIRYKSIHDLIEICGRACQTRKKQTNKSESILGRLPSANFQMLEISTRSHPGVEKRKKNVSERRPQQCQLVAVGAFASAFRYGSYVRRASSKHFHRCRSGYTSKCWEGTLNEGPTHVTGEVVFQVPCPARDRGFQRRTTGKDMWNREAFTEMKKMHKCKMSEFFWYLFKKNIAMNEHYNWCPKSSFTSYLLASWYKETSMTLVGNMRSWACQNTKKWQNKSPFSSPAQCQSQMLEILTRSHEAAHENAQSHRQLSSRYKY